MSASVYLFRVAFEKRMQKEIERFKAELGEKLEAVKSKLKIGEAQEDAKFRQLLDFRARQLSDFYWPLYIGLQKDNVIWRRVLDKRDAKDELGKRLGAAIERDVVLPNHDKLVSLIERNLHLAEADEKLEGFLLAYMRHVAIYRSIRAAGEEIVLPMAAGEEWPHDLFPSVERRMRGAETGTQLVSPLDLTQRTYAKQKLAASPFASPRRPRSRSSMPLDLLNQAHA